MPAALFTGVNAAGAMALIGSVGNLGGFVGPYLIGHIQSVTGSFQTGLIVLSISLMLCGVMMVFLKRESNKIKAGGKG
jgi:nitrate/nitrite transporter NarK